MIIRFPVVFFAIAVSLSNGNLLAQEIDAEAYRQKTEKARGVFFDRSASEQARVEAAKEIGFPDDGTFQKMLDLGKDRDEPDKVRWEALQRYPWTEEWILTIVDILDDPNNGGEFLNSELIRVASQKTTTTPRAEIQQAMKRAFRSCLSDDRNRVRENAYYVLAAGQDSVATSRLVDGLKNGGINSPIEVSKAIEIVETAGPNKHFGVLRQYLESKDTKTLQRAVSALSADDQSREKIAQLIRETTTDDAVRVQALRAMSRFDENYASYAIPIIKDEAVSSKIRDAAITGMTGQINYRKVPDQVKIEFVEAIESTLIEKPDVPNKRALMLIDRLKKSVPAVNKYFQERVQKK